MRRHLNLLLTFTLCLALLAAAAPAFAQGATYRVEVHNLTRGQVISPPVVVSHSRDMAVFYPGAPASAELAAVAEDAMNEPLVDLLMASPEVVDVVVADGGPIPPGHSAVVEIEAGFPFDRISAVGMLVTTNDAFFGLDSVQLPIKPRRDEYYVLAYDSGSEANNEECAFIPGPPCGNMGVRDTAGAEGFVHVHAGVHGSGDLVPTMHDWRNPVAKVVITRL